MNPILRAVFDSVLYKLPLSAMVLTLLSISV